MPGALDLLLAGVEHAQKQLEEQTRQQRYLTDPVAWVADTTGEFLWSKQREIYDAFVKHPKVAVKAGHGVGKSMSACRLGAWWVSVHPPEQTWLITTAPTYEQVQNIYWQELQMAHAKGSLTGTITGDCKWRAGRLTVGMGRKPSDYNAHAFQGIHRDFVLVVVDEACGVSGHLREGASNITTGKHCRTLAIGNPDDPNSRFADLCKGAPTDGTSGMSDKGWWVINVSVLDSPGFTDEEVPDDVRDRMPSDDWLAAKRLEVGEGSPLWMSKVLGQFPEDAADGIIPSSWVAACRNLPDDRPAPKSQLVQLGIDVGASDNGDQTVVYEMRGGRVGRRWAIRMRDHVKLAAWVVNKIRVTGANVVNIDATGVGHGLANLVTAYGKRGHHRARVCEVNFGARAQNHKRFRNVRAEMHWMMREGVQHRRVDLTPVEGSDIHAGVTDGAAAELTAPKYTQDTQGRVLVTPKDEVREQLGRSPDDADALLLACYNAPKVRNGGSINA